MNLAAWLPNLRGVRVGSLPCIPCTLSGDYDPHADHLRVINVHSSQLFDCPIHRATTGGCETVAVGAGPGVHLLFVESGEGFGEEEERRMAGVHICIYIDKFRRSFDRLLARKLLWTNPRCAPRLPADPALLTSHWDTFQSRLPHTPPSTLTIPPSSTVARLDTCDSWEEAVAGRQFRFKDVVDPKSGEKLLELEHETRSVRHFQFLKDVHYVA